ncbi:hypothetical protein Poli38472_003502 [Pythium oligandrum]|uniref:Chitin-binding type-4 domain-containing protein n=1 Tax=Pythium oligandrum TaxID=41045 RepID=A0A8K1C6R3_PYTOL|nr:hypothetical protein Poli38472_003502 [Pythium oligandrum]|eukprot:TMW57577.1 hypothetical protein Poli38472_003502 [Pythium oligandrum]
MVRTAAIIASLALALPAAVNAHGSISNPKPTFLDIYNKNAPSVLNAGTPGYTGLDYDLKAEAEKLGSKCGKTDANGASQPIPADGVISFDISAVHIGPCVVYLGNEKVAESKNCWTDYPDKKIKIDTSKCGSGCQLRWIWMATHTSPWEFFDNCVNLGSGGGASTSTDTTPAPAASSAAPAATTAAPAASSAAPAATTTTPSTTAPASTTAPSTGSGKYKYCGAARADSAALGEWCNTNCPSFCPGDMCCEA